jgi:prepilin-type processing-associated H-X9-DG protein
MILTADRNIYGPTTTDGQNSLLGNQTNTIVTLGTNTVAGGTKVGWSSASIHQGQGNIGLADGSVQQASSSFLRQQLDSTGDTAAPMNPSTAYGNAIMFP